MMLPASCVLQKTAQRSLSVARGRSYAAALLSLSLMLSACAGSAQGSASAKSGGDANAEGEANFDVEGESAWDMTDDSQSEEQTAANATPSRAQSLSAGQEAPLLGARHDLLLAEGSRENCKCLATILGPASAPGFVWTGRVPATDNQTQLVIALGSEGIKCSGVQGGASYMGYERSNGDVIVKVEEAVEGRPVTHGAIIPRPDQGHQVYVQPSGSIPYGRGLGGEARCALGSGG